MNNAAPRLQGKVALVTGAGRRLGQAIAVALAEEGADLLLHVHHSSGEDVSHAVRQLGGNAHILPADLSTTTGAMSLIHRVRSFVTHIDILVNNAAVFFPTPLSELSMVSWRTMLQTNLTSPFILALSFGRMMQKQDGGGTIIHLGDWMGVRPVPRYLSYCVSKSGIGALTQALAKALAPKVRVNAIAPGPVLLPDSYSEETVRNITAETPLQRIGQAFDVARTVRMIACSSFVTGATYMVDGGWLTRVDLGKETSV